MLLSHLSGLSKRTKARNDGVLPKFVKSTFPHLFDLSSYPDFIVQASQATLLRR
jgi:hypothetical protein